MSLMSEFKEFALKGNVVDMAVGLVIGASFGKIVKSLVSDVIMPPIGMLTGGVDFKDLTYELQAADAVNNVKQVTLSYGSFINTVFEFTIIAFAIFMVIKLMNRAKKRFEKEAEEAPAKEPSEDILLLREIRDRLNAN